MSTAPDPVLRRLRWVSFAVFFLAMAWWLAPWLERYLIGRTTEPRTVTARGELAADERNTIEIFRLASPSVVFISTQQRVVNVWTRDVFSVPRGTGSGFVWDEFGHVVTNNHVIDQASEANVRLSDGRTYRATLIGASSDHDLAVLRIRVPFDRPPPVPIGSSGDLLVGRTDCRWRTPSGRPRDRSRCRSPPVSAARQEHREQHDSAPFPTGHRPNPRRKAHEGKPTKVRTAART